MENSLHYLHVEPDNSTTQTVEKVEVPIVVGKNKKEAKEALAAFKEVVFVGKGDKVIDSSVKEGTVIYDTQKVIILMEKPVMPNLQGWSSRDVHRLAEMLDIPIKVTGEGFVTKQNIKKNKVIKDNMTLEVTLSSDKKKKSNKKKSKKK